MNLGPPASPRMTHRRPSLVICALLAFVGATGKIAAQTTTPTISSLQPATATAGGPAFVLTITGTNFVSGASVLWNGISLPATFVSSTQLTTNVPASLIAQPGLATVAVVNPNAGQSTAKGFTILPAPLAIATVPPLFSGTVGQPYTQTFTASGGVPPYQWAIVSGTTGALTLDPGTGTLQGTPLVAETLNFTVRVTDSAGTNVSRAFSIVINAPTLTITTASSLPAGTLAVGYSTTFSAVGGTAPYTWLITGGAVPGLTLDPAGILAGTPTSPGTFAFTAQAKDAAGLSATKSFTLIINPGALKLTTSPTQLPAATVGTPYSQTMTASGGVMPYTWSANGLPEGLSIDASSGVISGTPTAPGTFTFTVRVTDRALASAVDLFHITVGVPAAPALTISGLPATANPADQISNLQVSLAAPYPVALSGQLLLSFAPDTGAGDTTVRFSNGGTTAAFDIPAGSTAAKFQDANLALQTGTVAGTITLTVWKLQVSGVDITPSTPPASSTRIERAAPAVTNAKLIRNANGFNIEITGFCTAREVTQATFTFTASGGQTLQTAQFDVSVESLFSQWFQAAGSSSFGSQFTFTQPFTVQGDASAVLPDSVTLSNRIGSVTVKVAP